MDINWLEDDELRYELEIRQIYNVVGREAQKRHLRAVLREELTGKPKLPNLDNLDFSSETLSCEKKYDILFSESEGFMSVASGSCRSRSIHLINRLDRLLNAENFIVSSEVADGLMERLVKLRNWLKIPATQREVMNDSLATGDSLTNDSVRRENELVRIRPEERRRGSAGYRVIQENIGENIEDRRMGNSAVYRPRNDRNQDYDDFDQGNFNNFRNDQFSCGRNRVASIIARWNIKFSGDGKGLKVNEFLSQIKMLAETDKISELDLFGTVFHLFSNNARIWFRAFYKKFKSWDDLVVALRKEYLPDDYDYWLQKDIDKRLQRKDESFGLFLANMELLFEELSISYSEKEKVKIIMRNMLSIYSEKLALIEINSLETLGNYCRKIENLNYSLNNRNLVRGNGCYSNKPINEVYTVDKREVLEDRKPILKEPGKNLDLVSGKVVTKVDVHNGFNTQIKCFNCGETGHPFKMCKIVKNRVFCYVCGLANVFTPNCPQCNRKCAGNSN